MQLTVLVGEDDLALRKKRDELLKEHANIEQIDVALDKGSLLVDAVCSVSLFGGKRVVAAENIEELSENSLALLLKSAKMSDAFIVARGGNLSPNLKEGLKKIGEVKSFTLPKGKGLSLRVEEMLASSGVIFDFTTRKMLLERASHDLDRLSSVLKQLQIANIKKPTPAQLSLLLGTTLTPGVPWNLSDFLEKGDIKSALKTAKDLEPIPTLGYLSGRLLQVGKLADDNITTPEKAMEKLSLTHHFQAEKLLSLTKKLEAKGVRKSWDLLVTADREIKISKDPSVVLDLLLVELARLWGN